VPAQFLGTFELRAYPLDYRQQGDAIALILPSAMHSISSSYVRRDSDANAWFLSVSMMSSALLSI
jgi:hypothetical protein